MKNKLIGLILFLPLLLLFNPALAESQSICSNGYISVSSSMTKEVDPNIATVSFAVETQSKALDLAVNENKKIVNNLIQSLTPRLDSSKGDLVSTGNYIVRPEYAYPKQGERKLTGYTVINSIKIKTKNTSNLGKLIDIVTSLGANRVDSISFNFENQQTVCNDMYPLLVKDAYSQAATIAKSLNTNIKGIKSVNASCSIQYAGSFPVATRYAKGVDSAESTPIEPDKIKIYSSVNAEFNVQ